MGGINWRKASYSGNGEACIEAASGQDMILVRDTTNREGFALTVPARAWAEFTATLR